MVWPRRANSVIKWGWVKEGAVATWNNSWHENSLGKELSLKGKYLHILGEK